MSETAVDFDCKSFATDLRLNYTKIIESYDEKDLNRLSSKIKQMEENCKTFVLEKFYRLKEQEPLHPILLPFGLLNTIEMGRLETAHTRTLAWLLDSRREHGFGTSLLEQILSITDPDLASEYEVEIIEVTAEKSLTCGRGDIWVEGFLVHRDEKVPFLVFIEAKIDSSEDDGQLEKYEKVISDWCKKKNLKGSRPKAICILLTPDNRRPISTSGKHDWKLLSFSHLFDGFWAVINQMKDVPGFHFARYYLSGIAKDIIGANYSSIESTSNYWQFLDLIESEEGR